MSDFKVAYITAGGWQSTAYVEDPEIRPGVWQSWNKYTDESLLLRVDEDGEWHELEA